MHHAVRAIDVGAHIDLRGASLCVAGFDAVAKEVADRLAQQHFVGIDRSELAVDRQLRSRGVFGGALDDRPQIHRRERRAASGPAKLRNRVTISPSACVSAANAFDVRTLRGGQRRGIHQPRVAVNGRETVAELVRETRGELAEPSQRLFQPQLFFEREDVGEIAEETDRAGRTRVRPRWETR